MLLPALHLPQHPQHATAWLGLTGSRSLAGDGISSLLPGLDPTLAWAACLQVPSRLCLSLPEKHSSLLLPAHDGSYAQSQHQQCLAGSNSTDLKVVLTCHQQRSAHHCRALALKLRKALPELACCLMACTPAQQCMTLA